MSRIAGIFFGGGHSFHMLSYGRQISWNAAISLGVLYFFLRARGPELKAHKRSGGNPERLGKTGNDTNVQAEAACVVFVHIV